jgi:hypothetical protein
MKIFKLIIFLTIFLLTNSCKKDKLTGDAKSLIGTWQWSKDIWPYKTPETAGYSMTLEFKEKGKYEIKKNNKRIEGGRIIYENSNGTYWWDFQLEFKRNDLFSKKQQFIGKCLLDVKSQDSLFILENSDWTDQPYHLYVRQN